MGVANQHHPVPNFTEEPPPKFAFAAGTVRFVESHNGSRIGERLLGLRKWHSMFCSIGGFLPGIPGELQRLNLAAFT